MLKHFACVGFTWLQQGEGKRSGFTLSGCYLQRERRIPLRLTTTVPFNAGALE